MPKTEIADSFTRTWDGKKFFKDIGTFLVGDGEYRHRLQDLIFGYRYNRTTKKSDPVTAEHAEEGQSCADVDCRG